MFHNPIKCYELIKFRGLRDQEEINQYTKRNQPDESLKERLCSVCYKLSMSIMLTIFDVSIKEKRVYGSLCFELLPQQMS